MTNKNLVNYIIQKNRTAKMERTSIEVFVSGILDEIDAWYYTNYSVRAGTFYLRCDFIASYSRATASIKELIRVIEVQGPYHNTEKQKKKTAWRNEQLNKAGYHVILVPWQVCTAKHRDYLKAELQAALTCKEMVREIVS